MLYEYTTGYTTKQQVLSDLHKMFKKHVERDFVGFGSIPKPKLPVGLMCTIVGPMWLFVDVIPVLRWTILPEHLYKYEHFSKLLR